LLDYAGKDFDKEPPEWIFMEPTELENSRDYEDMYVFKFESEPSKSRQGAKLLQENFDVQREMTRIVSTRVKDKAVTAVAGDNNLIESYMEEVVKVLAEARFSGVRKASDFWVLKRYKNPNGVEEDLYSYYSLYTISRENLDRLVQEALAGADMAKPKTEEEKAARSRVKEAFNEGF
jgi:hypothetical protein